MPPEDVLPPAVRDPVHQHVEHLARKVLAAVTVLFKELPLDAPRAERTEGVIRLGSEEEVVDLHGGAGVALAVVDVFDVEGGCRRAGRGRSALSPVAVWVRGRPRWVSRGGLARL